VRAHARSMLRCPTSSSRLGGRNDDRLDLPREPPVAGLWRAVGVVRAFDARSHMLPARSHMLPARSHSSVHAYVCAGTGTRKSMPRERLPSLARESTASRAARARYLVGLCSRLVSLSVRPVGPHGVLVVRVHDAMPLAGLCASGARVLGLWGVVGRGACAWHASVTCDNMQRGVAS